MLIYGHMSVYLAVDAVLISLCKFFGLRGIERDGSFTYRSLEEQDEEHLV